MSRLIVRPIMNQNQILEQLISILKAHNLTFDSEYMFSQSNKITMCILLLFHKTRFLIEKGCIGHCFVEIDDKEVDGNGNIIKKTFVTLCIKGYTPVKRDGTVFSIAHTILSTELAVNQWCDPEFSLNKPDANEQEPLLDASDFVLNENFQLIRADKANSLSMST